MDEVFNWFERNFGYIIGGLGATVGIITFVICIVEDWLGREGEDDGKMGK